MRKTSMKKSQVPLARSKSLESKTKLSGSEKLRARKKTSEQVQEQKEGIERMWALFELHWMAKDHRCEECNTPIYGENKTIYHHHMIPKAKWKQYKYDICNLILLCWSCHSQVEAGYPGPVVVARTEGIKQLYMI